MDGAQAARPDDPTQAAGVAQRGVHVRGHTRVHVRLRLRLIRTVPLGWTRTVTLALTFAYRRRRRRRIAPCSRRSSTLRATPAGGSIRCRQAFHGDVMYGASQRRSLSQTYLALLHKLLTPTSPLCRLSAPSARRRVRWNWSRRTTCRPPLAKACRLCVRCCRFRHGKRVCVWRRVIVACKSEMVWTRVPRAMGTPDALSGIVDRGARGLQHGGLFDAGIVVGWLQGACQKGP